MKKQMVVVTSEYHVLGIKWERGVFVNQRFNDVKKGEERRVVLVMNAVQL
jgi:hypothetical protein